MKLYEVTTISIRNNGEYGDEYQTFLGFDFEKALAAKKEALDSFDRLSSYDKKSTTVECRVYEIDEIDTTDEDEIINAMCECGGYDLF